MCLLVPFLLKAYKSFHTIIIYEVMGISTSCLRNFGKLSAKIFSSSQIFSNQLVNIVF